MYHIIQCSLHSAWVKTEPLGGGDACWKHPIYSFFALRVSRNGPSVYNCMPYGDCNVCSFALTWILYWHRSLTLAV